jgi:hypothetical protein
MKFAYKNFKCAAIMLEFTSCQIVHTGAFNYHEINQLYGNKLYDDWKSLGNLDDRFYEQWKSIPAESIQTIPW